jgi:hypothetical protein
MAALHRRAETPILVGKTLPPDQVGAMTMKRLLACGAIAGPLFTLAWVVEGATRAHYNPLRHPISSLELGDSGWMQPCNPEPRPPWSQLTHPLRPSLTYSEIDPLRPGSSRGRRVQEALLQQGSLLQVPISSSYPTGFRPLTRESALTIGRILRT